MKHPIFLAYAAIFAVAAFLGGCGSNIPLPGEELSCVEQVTDECVPEVVEEFCTPATEPSCFVECGGEYTQVRCPNGQPTGQISDEPPAECETDEYAQGFAAGVESQRLLIEQLASESEFAQARADRCEAALSQHLGKHNHGKHKGHHGRKP